jgi:hypothetical protein
VYLSSQSLGASIAFHERKQLFSHTHTFISPNVACIWHANWTCFATRSRAKKLLCLGTLALLIFLELHKLQFYKFFICLRLLYQRQKCMVQWTGKISFHEVETLKFVFKFVSHKSEIFWLGVQPLIGPTWMKWIVGFKMLQGVVFIVISYSRNFISNTLRCNDVIKYSLPCSHTIKSFICWVTPNKIQYLLAISYFYVAKILFLFSFFKHNMLSTVCGCIIYQFTVVLQTFTANVNMEKKIAKCRRNNPRARMKLRTNISIFKMCSSLIILPRKTLWYFIQWKLWITLSKFSLSSA